MQFTPGGALPSIPLRNVLMRYNAMTLGRTIS